jgi:hypothetical protein
VKCFQIIFFSSDADDVARSTIFFDWSRVDAASVGATSTQMQTRQRSIVANMINVEAVEQKMERRWREEHT